jgi:hypothetical protein
METVNDAHINNIGRLTVLIIMILITAFAAACSITSSEADDHAGEHEHEEIDRIPNNCASIQILSPLDGTTFQEGEQVVVEVQVDNFELGANGRHWHIYVDGESKGMVTGGDIDQALRDLEPGVIEISVFLTLSNHDEMEDGDAVTITVEAAE